MIRMITPNPTALSETQQLTRKTGNIASRKIWLPKLIYDLLPYFYIASGLAAILATLYITHWFWVLPQYLLFSVACIHLGIAVARRRRKGRKIDSADYGQP